MTDHGVVIAGGGPTGTMLAAELTLAGADVVVVERRATPDIESSRAGGLHARTLEILDQRGVAGRFLEAGQAMQVQFFSMIPLDISDVPTRHPYGLALWQRHIERLLAGWADELGVVVRRGCEVTGFAQDDDGVDVALSDGRSLRARYLVGCDGGRSVVRRAAGIGFPGWDASTSYLIAELRTREAPQVGLRPTERGTNGIGPLDDGERFRVVVCEGDVGRTGEPSLDELSAAMTAVWGTDFGPYEPTWLSRFTDMTRQAESYRAGRVLLAGDAAHVHSPNGGQGLNLGVQDAVNLGWKLARVVDGTSGDDLLDTYHAERHPVGARVLRTTMAMTGLSRGDDRTLALRDTMTDLFSLDEPRRRYGAMIAGLDVHYDLGEGHPLLGRRMPDLDLVTDAGPRTVASLLHAARPVLLELSGAALDASAWSGRVDHVAASCDGACELPVLGAVAAPSAVLIRPDGYVTWVGEGGDGGLAEALARWFGPPAAERHGARAGGRLGT